MATVKRRFGTVTILSTHTKVLGATAEEWDKALTGNMRETLKDVKRRVDSGVKRDSTKATTFDLASFAGKLNRTF